MRIRRGLVRWDGYLLPAAQKAEVADRCDELTQRGRFAEVIPDNRVQYARLGAAELPVPGRFTQERSLSSHHNSVTGS